MGATSSTACDQGLIKRVHVRWGPALSFLYCTDFVDFHISEILLKAPVNIILNRFFKSATIDIKEVSTARQKNLLCELKIVNKYNWILVWICTQDEDIASSWWMFPRIGVIIAKCGIGCKPK